MRSSSGVMLSLTIFVSMQDTALPLRLMAKLMTLQQLMAMADACYVPIDYLITRGQGIKLSHYLTSFS